MSYKSNDHKVKKSRILSNSLSLSMSFIIVAVLLLIYRQLYWLDHFHNQLMELQRHSLRVRNEVKGFHGQMSEIQSLLNAQSKQERIKFVTHLLHYEVLKEVQCNANILSNYDDELVARIELKRLGNKHDCLCMKQRGDHYDFTLCNASNTTP